MDRHGQHPLRVPLVDRVRQPARLASEHEHDVLRQLRVPIEPLPFRTEEKRRAERWQLAIVTNGLPSVQRAKVAALGVAPLVDHVVYADEHTPGGKPAASVFRHVLRKLGLPARRVILVGDDPRCDIAGARAVGIRTIRLITPAYPGPLAGDADVTIDTIDALPAAMAALLDLVASDAA